jgi:hypothetical protein
MNDTNPYVQSVIDRLMAEHFQTIPKPEEPLPWNDEESE